LEYLMKQNVKTKNPYFCFGLGLLFIQLKTVEI